MADGGWRRTSLRGLDLAQLDPLGSNIRVSVRGDSRGVVKPLEEAVHDPRVQRYFGQVVAPESDTFTALHYAFFNAGVVIVVPRGTAVEEPIWIEYTADGAALLHTLLIAEDESDLKLVEDFRGGSAFASGVVEQVVGANAHARYVHLQRWGSDVWNFSWQRALLAQDASLRTLNVAVGARMARNSVQVELDGRGSQADLHHAARSYQCDIGAQAFDIGNTKGNRIFAFRDRTFQLVHHLVFKGFFHSTLQKLQLPALEEEVWSAITEGWSSR